MVGAVIGAARAGCISAGSDGFLGGVTQPASSYSAPTAYIPLAPPNGSVPPQNGPTPFGPSLGTGGPPTIPPGPAAGYGASPGYEQLDHGPAGFGQTPGYGQPATTAPAPTDPSLTLAGAAALLAVVLTGLGLSIPFTDANFWSTGLAWALFAMAAALVQLAPLFGRNSAGSPRRLWTVGACGTGGLAGFWVLIALPGVSSNQGFALTLAVAASVTACWLSPGRPR